MPGLTTRIDELTRRGLLKGAVSTAVAAGLLPKTVRAQSGAPLTATILGSMEHIHPWHDINHDVGVVKNLIYSNLVRTMPDNSLVPEVAAEMPTVSEDGLTYEFRLREDVFFHNGAQLTADDVVYTFDTYMRTGRRASEFEIFLDGWAKVDEFNVTFTLSRPWSGWLSYLTKYMGIVQAGTDPESLYDGSHGASSGPYRVVSFTPDVQVLLEANPNYYATEEARQHQIRIIRVPDAATHAAHLLSGAVDIISTCPPNQFNALVSREGLGGGSRPSAGIFYAVLNRRMAPFDNVHLRRAVSHAIDREFICNEIYHGLVTPTSLPATPDEYWYDSELAAELDYDPERVAYDLEQAGMPNGFEFEATIPVPSAYVEARDAALVIQASLAEHGIRMNLRQVDFSSMFQLARELDYVSYWFPSMQPSIEDYLLPLSYMCDGRQFMSHPCNPAYDEELVGAFRFVEPQDRVSHLRNATAILARDATNVWIGRLNTFHVWKDNVDGFEPSYQYTMDLRGAHLS